MNASEQHNDDARRAMEFVVGLFSLVGLAAAGWLVLVAF